MSSNAVFYLRLFVVAASPLYAIGCGSSSSQVVTTSQLPDKRIIQGAAKALPAPEAISSETEGQAVATPTQDSNIDWSSYLGYWFNGNGDPAPDNEDPINADISTASPQSPNTNNNTTTQDDNLNSQSAVRALVNGVYVPAVLSSGGTPVQHGQQLTIVVTEGEVSTLHYNENIYGPIDVVADNSLTVLGQTVRISDSTHTNGPGNKFVVGEIIEVSGVRDANGHIHATFMKKGLDSVGYSVRGLITDHDLANNTFRIGSLTVDYQQAEFSRLQISELANQQFVEVENTSGLYEPGSYYLAATKIQRYNSELVAFESQSIFSDRADYTLTGSETESKTWVKYEAYITSISDADRFTLGSVDVQILESTQLEGGTREDLAVNQLVDIEGLMLNNALVQATNIEFENDESLNSNSGNTDDAGNTANTVANSSSDTLDSHDNTVLVNTDTSVESDRPTLVNTSNSTANTTDANETGSTQITASPRPEQENNAESHSNSESVGLTNGSSQTSDGNTSIDNIDWASYLGYWHNGTNTDSNSTDNSTPDSVLASELPNDHDTASISDEQGEVEIEGILKSVNYERNRFTLSGGIEIHPGPVTRFEDTHSNQINESAFFNQLHVGSTKIRVEWRNFTSYEQPPYEIKIED